MTAERNRWKLGDIPLNGRFVHPSHNTVWRVHARVDDQVRVKHHGTGAPATMYADAEVIRLAGDAPRRLVACAWHDAWDSRNNRVLAWDSRMQTWPYIGLRWNDEAWWPIVPPPARDHGTRPGRDTWDDRWRVDGEYIRRGADYVIAGTVDPEHLAAYLADFDPRPTPETIIDRWDPEGGRAGDLIAALRKHGYQITDIEEQGRE